MRRVATISKSASIEDAAKLIMDTQFTHIPVVSEESKLEGIVTAWDISKAVAKKHEKLEEIMTRAVITTDQEEPLDLVIRKMEKGNISALPVIDNDRRLIGIITSDEISKLVGKRRRWKLRI
jgi:homoserine O-acetyltransferase